MSRQPVFTLGPLLWALVLVLLGPPSILAVAGEERPDVKASTALSEKHGPAASPVATGKLSQLVREERWREAAELAEALAKELPYDPMVFYWLGEARLQLGNPIGSVQALRSAQRLGLDTKSLHETLGAAYYALYQFKLFEDQMQRAIEIDPRASRPWYNLGRYYETARGDFTGALKFFEKAKEMEPEDEKSWAHTGFCLEVSGRIDEARRAYETAIALVESKGVQWSLPHQGMSRLLIGDQPESALQFARKAVQIEPNVDSNHLVLARAYEKLGKLREAVSELGEAIRLSPTNLVPRRVLARIYGLLGMKDAAQNELKMIQEITQVYGAR
ncbi:MAG: tetratricopeptide repeat protein [Acidobacteriota bacterium]